MNEKYATRGKAISLAKRMKQEEFVNRATTVHGDKYDYSLVEYVNAHTKVTIVCKVHGPFTQRPHDHVKGANKCPQCGMIERFASHKKTALKKYITNSKKVHNNAYEYLEHTYTDELKITAVCPTHGEWVVNIDNHSRGGHKCPGCNKPGKKSKVCDQWLDSLGVPKEFREFRLKIDGRTITADAYDRDTNTVYEFWGDFWHGNPSLFDGDAIHPHKGCTFNKLYQQTLDKISLIESAGYTLVQIWENEWSQSTCYTSTI